MEQTGSDGAIFAAAQGVEQDLHRGAGSWPVVDRRLGLVERRRPGPGGHLVATPAVTAATAVPPNSWHRTGRQEAVAHQVQVAPAHPAALDGHHTWPAPGTGSALSTTERRPSGPKAAARIGRLCGRRGP